MSEEKLRGLWVGTPPRPRPHPYTHPHPHPSVEWTVCEPAAVTAAVAAQAVDVLLVQAEWDGWAECVDAVAVVLLHDAFDAASGLQALRAGAQDVLTPAELDGDAGAFRLHAAAERHRQRVATRQSFATDVQTGLPHEGQLLEHMSHLMALREREPAPMALLALRIEGFATTAARLGGEAAGALRRKVAVRLRAGLRSSDVVASLGSDSFAVLLSSIEAPADAARVAAKLQAALAQPFALAGQDVALATALGIAASPADGALPSLLLRRAVGLAAAAHAVGRSGFANHGEAGGTGGAANDD